MSVYLTGDIHGDRFRFWSIGDYCKEHKTTTDDWLICLGDVGLNYYGPKSKKEIALKNEVAKLPIENMRKLFGDEAVRWFCICNAYKYRFRDGSKPGVSAEQDHEKAHWYEDYAVKMMGEQRYY